MIALRSLTAGAVALSLIAPAASQIMMDVAAPDVKIGLNGPDFDACGGVGKVVTADDAEGSVPVFNLTQAWRVRIDHLPPGTVVWMCETRDGWEGIVFPSHPHQKFGDCGVSLPVEAPKTYHGPCKSGWINPKSVELIAG